MAWEVWYQLLYNITERITALLMTFLDNSECLKDPQSFTPIGHGSGWAGGGYAKRKKFGFIFLPSLGPTTHQNLIEFDAKMPSDVDFIF